MLGMCMAVNSSTCHQLQSSAVRSTNKANERISRLTRWGLMRASQNSCCNTPLVQMPRTAAKQLLSHTGARITTYCEIALLRLNFARKITTNWSVASACSTTARRHTHESINPQTLHIQNRSSSHFVMICVQPLCNLPCLLAEEN